MKVWVGTGIINSPLPPPSQHDDDYDADIFTCVLHSYHRVGSEDL